MRGDSRLTAFVATTDPDRARDFYEGKLGLKFLADEGLPCCSIPTARD